MDDLISRQAAIEVIDAVMPVNPNKSEYASGIACGAALAMTYVKQLPSAQSERKMCNLCKYYEGVHRVQGHAPCSFWKIGGVLYDDYCSRWEKFDG